MKSFVNIFLFVVFFHFLPNNALSAQTEINDIESIKIKTEKLRYKGRFDKAIYILETEIDFLTVVEPMSVNIGYLKNDLAATLIRKSFHQNKLDETALEIYQYNIDNYKINNDSILLSDALYGKGYYQFRKGEPFWDNSKNNLNRSLEIRRILNDHRGISEALNILGVISLRQSSFKSSQDYLNECLKYSKLSKSKFIEAEAERHLGYLNVFQNHYDKTLIHLNRSYELRKVIGYIDGAIFGAISLAQIHLRDERYGDALPLLKYALRKSKRINSSLGIVRTEWELGNMYFKQGQNKKSLKSLNKVIYLAKKLNNSSFLKRAEYIVSKIK